MAKTCYIISTGEAQITLFRDGARVGIIRDSTEIVYGQKSILGVLISHLIIQEEAINELRELAKATSREAKHNRKNKQYASAEVSRGMATAYLCSVGLLTAGK